MAGTVTGSADGSVMGSVMDSVMGSVIGSVRGSESAVAWMDASDDTWGATGASSCRPAKQPYSDPRHTASISRENSLLIIIPPPIKLRS